MKQNILTFYCVCKEDMSVARDIAEFEKNKPFAKPISMQDGFNVSEYFGFLQLSLYINKNVNMV